MGRSGNVVLEGRDIGSVVFPDAEVKFFLSASPEERGRRRYLELLAKGEDVTLEKTVAEVAARDARDEQREVAPLRMADDALLIDSTGVSIEDVLSRMSTIVRDVELGDRPQRRDTEKTLKIILAEQAGFCFGVKRATQMAFEAAERGGKTYTLGRLSILPR